MRFNTGMAEASSQILQELHLDQDCTGGQRAAEKNQCSVVNANQKRAAPVAFPAAAKKGQISLRVPYNSLNILATFIKCLNYAFFFNVSHFAFISCVFL